MLLLFPKSWEVHNFKILVSSVQSHVLASSVQIPVSNALSPIYSFKSLEFSFQHLGSSV